MMIAKRVLEAYWVEIHTQFFGDTLARIGLQNGCDMKNHVGFDSMILYFGVAALMRTS